MSPYIVHSTQTAYRICNGSVADGQPSSSVTRFTAPSADHRDHYWGDKTLDSRAFHSLHCSVLTVLVLSQCHSFKHLESVDGN